MLLNAARDAVVESIDGLLLTRPDLARLDGYPGVKVVRRRAVDPAKVALVSGGGAGHEPLHAGFVGAGCLTAAVSGDVFASPHVRAIHAAIAACGSAAGTLCIVKNYTGDRLAFGLAAERARAEGRAVETVYVADDAAVDGGPVTGRRGIAGTVFVHKVAGALAEAGAHLGAVAAAARAVAAATVSVTAALSVCRLPGQPASARLDGPLVEVGLGIHGEPGRTTLPAVPPADELAATLLATLAERLVGLRGHGSGGAAAPIPVAVLVNNAGGLSQLELGVFTTAVGRAVAAHNTRATAAAGGSAAAPLPPLDVARLYASTLVTSTDMRGVSVSLLPLDGAVAAAVAAAGVPGGPLQALDAPAPHTAWPSSWGTGAALAPGQVLPLPQTAAAAVAATSEPPPASPAADSAAATPPSSSPQAQRLAACVTAACAALAGQAGRLNELDALSGDADAGNTAALIAAAVADVALPRVLAAHGGSGVSFCGLLAAFLAAAGDAIADAAGGSSGVLYALMATAGGRAAGDAAADAPPAAVVAAALGAAVDAAQAYGNARPGYRTMLDALVPAHAALASNASGACDARELAAAVALAASTGADSTADMVPRAGRASYVPFQTLRGSPDPGAVAVATWIGAVAGAL